MARKRKSTSTNQKVTGDGRLCLLITVVNRNKGEFYADLIQNYEVNMQWFALGQGTASAEILRRNGLVPTDKAVIFSVIRADKVPDVMRTLAEKFDTIKNGKGIAYTIPFSSIIGVASWGFLANNRKTVKELNNDTASV